MPMYEYRCLSCGETFEVLRSAAEADAPADCSAGHSDAVRALSVVAPPARAGDTSRDGAGPCCASGCVCGRN